MAGLSADFSHKQLVDITIHAVKMTFSAPIRLNIIWKRKNRRVETGPRILIPAGSGMLDVNETLTMSETLSLSSTGSFQEKTAELYFQAVVEKGSKVVGKVILSVGADKVERIELPLEGCPDATATVILSVNSRAEEEMGHAGESLGNDRANNLAVRRVKLRASPKLHFKSERESKEWEGGEVLHSDRLKLTELSERAEDLEKENAALLASNSDLKKKIRTMTDEQRKKEEEWETRLQDLEYEKTRLTRNLERTQNELKQRLEDSSAEASLQSINKQLQNREAELAKIKQEMRVLEEARMKAESDAHFMKAQYDSYQKGVEDLNQKLEKSNRRADDLAGELQQARRENETLKREMQESATIGQEKSSQEKDQRIRETEQRYAKEVAGLQAELKRVQAEAEQTRKRESDAMRADFTRRMNEINTGFEQEKESMNLEFEEKITQTEKTLKTQIEELSREMQRAKTEAEKTIASLRKQLQEAEAKRSEAPRTDGKEKEIADLRAEFNRKMMEANQEYEQEKESLTQDFESRLKENEKRNRQQHEGMEKEIQRIKAEAEQKMAAMRKQLQETEARQPSDSSPTDSAKDTEIADLRADINELILALDEAHHTSPDLALQLSELSQTLNQRDKTIQDLRTSATMRVTGEEGSPILFLQERVSELEEQLKNAESQMQVESEHLAEQNAGLERQLSACDNARRKAESELERLRYSNKQLQDALSRNPDVSPAQTTEIQRKQELFEAQLKLKSLQEEKALLEKRFVDMKAVAARGDLEREEAVSKWQSTETELRTQKQEYNHLLVEFNRVNERLGDALNRLNDIELEQHARQVVSPKNANQRK